MKKSKFILPVLALLMFNSCGNDDDTPATIDANVPVEVDQFYVRFLDNGQMSSIESTSYTDYEHYAIAQDIAFQNGEEAQKYFSASVNGTTNYNIENAAAARVIYRTNKWSSSDIRAQSFALEIMSSNQKEILCNQEDVLIEEIFQSQNNILHPFNFPNDESDDLLKTNFDLALFTVKYTVFDPISQNELNYRSSTNYDTNAIYSQPQDSFINITSVTEKIHEIEYGENLGFETTIYDYNYIIEGNGKVRVFNIYDAENDYKDLEFTFKIPSKRLVLLDAFSGVCN